MLQAVLQQSFLFFLTWCPTSVIYLTLGLKGLLGRRWFPFILFDQPGLPYIIGIDLIMTCSSATISPRKKSCNSILERMGHWIESKALGYHQRSTVHGVITIAQGIISYDVKVLYEFLCPFCYPVPPCHIADSPYTPRIVDRLNTSLQKYNKHAQI